MEHLRAGLRLLVDGVVHAELVPRHGFRGDDHGVAAFHVDGGMIVVRDARERRERLSLAAGAEDQLLVRRDLLQLWWAYEHAFGHLHVAEVARDVGVLAHRASDDANLAAEVDCDVDGLLHAVYVRRERGDEDPSLPQGKDLPKGLADDPLRLREAGTFGIRRVTEEQVDAP